MASSIQGARLSEKYFFEVLFLQEDVIICSSVQIERVKPENSNKISEEGGNQYQN